MVHWYSDGRAGWRGVVPVGGPGVCQLASGNSDPGVELERLMSPKSALKWPFQCDSGPDAGVDTESRASPTRETVKVVEATRRVD